MGGGGKGGSNTTTVQLPDSLEQGANEVLVAGLRAAALPYKPNKGVTIAGFAPQERAAMRNTSAMAEAFGLQGGNKNGLGLGKTQRGANGIYGYSSEGALNQMKHASTNKRQRKDMDRLRNSFLDSSDRVAREAGLPTSGK